MAHGVLERVFPAQGVHAQLTLVDNRFLVLEEEFDRILDGEDMAGAVSVAVIKHRGNRGGLARSGGADDQDQSTLLHDKVGQDVREEERVERRNVAKNETHDDRNRGPLAEQVDTEIADMGNAEGEVHLHGRFERLLLIGRHQLQGDLLDHRRIHDLLVDRNGIALNLDVDRNARGDEQIRCLFFRHQVEKFVQNHVISAA